jgi:WD40 repeat protein
VDGAPVAVTGGRDGTVRVWDLRTGAARGKPLGDDTGSVDAVAVGVVDGIPVAVTGGSDGVRVWDLRTGAARGIPLRGHTGGVRAVAVGCYAALRIPMELAGRRRWGCRCGVPSGGCNGGFVGGGTVPMR